MNTPELNDISREGLATSPTTPSKAISWPRNPRTSCDSCKQMKACPRAFETSTDNYEGWSHLLIGLGVRSNAKETMKKVVFDAFPEKYTVLQRRYNNAETNIQLSKKEMYLDRMEDRIKRMESAIITSGLHGTTEPEEAEDEEKSSSDKIESQAGLSNHLANLVINSNGFPNFIGWASGFSLFSPHGLRWISEKVDDKDEMAQLINKLSKRDYGIWGSPGADLWDPRPRSQHAPLPSKELALQYVDSNFSMGFFVTFNNDFPLLNQKVFNSYFEQQYSANPPMCAAWYALFNAVLCLGSIRTKSKLERHSRSSRLIDYTSLAQDTGVAYFRNASCCFHDLFFKEANFMAMQALTLMLFITTSSPNPQPAYSLSSAAGNLANTLGLHRNSDGLGVAPMEIEQRRNVFWVFYLIEKSTSLNLGRPSVIHDDDIAVDLPSKKPVLVQSLTGLNVHDIFQDYVKLSIIGSRIYSELYSASSQTKSKVDRMKVLGKLDDHLQRWRDAVPIDIRPEQPIRCSEEQYVSVFMMHFTYLDAVILLHRLSGYQESSKDAEAIDMESHKQPPRLSPRVYASNLLCLAAARRSIKLLDIFSSNDLQNQYLTWKALYYPLSASLVLFANILSNPADQHANSDIQLMNLISSFINHYVQPGTSFAATPTIRVFTDLCGMAARSVARLPPQPSYKMKRLPETDNPGQSNPTSLSSVPTVSDPSSWIDWNIQPTIPSALPSSTSTYHETDTFASRALFGSDQQLHQGHQDPEININVKDSQKPTENSSLVFAPFIATESSEVEYNPIVYDPLLPSSMFGWDITNMWVPSFESDV